ncbi:MBL fold metallo-hydrolase [Polynucleobacter sp. MWH-Loch1C5]|uniref:MBL fold metallo-hydrolase RNA specificity domain-containing protein n=1 Tax=Polynucleobacter sp. MWH-Loch1C5 TaxID=2689108 RepID=UPI001C0C7171|nr:MBL fold metallo-hydrolase [Polynucleobacter sp. MWH-Loch1C5]MBU3542048.1 MBL fold metallo-hydrolase [Polynucleobacter sp. MWH-Loch1C5]
MKTQLNIDFFGAAGEVTGSKHGLSGQCLGQPFKILIDYGMHQGGRDADEKNLRHLPWDPTAIDAITLTHAHIDHSGLLPRLCAQGFKGHIYCTAATFALLKILLLDSAHIQKNDYDRAVKKKERGRYRGELPAVLYSTHDVEACLKKVKVIDYNNPTEILPGITLEFHNAGHILGSAIATLDFRLDSDNSETYRVTASGDLGMFNKPLLPNPEYIHRTDALLIEATYGDRDHKSLDETRAELTEVINKTLAHGGNIIMPAFAVGRAQEILLMLMALVKAQKVPELHVWLDSPMAVAATHLTEQYFSELDEDAQALITWYKRNPHALHLRFVADVEESKALNRIRSGAVIISASGMCEAGRILHHLKHNLPDARNAIIMTGFQAYGTLGRRIVDGQTMVRIMGEEINVKASVHTIGGLSAHAGQADLLNWLKGFQRAPQKTYIVHGETEPTQIFQKKIMSELGWLGVQVAKALQHERLLDQ